jgi:hypothetical protein
LAHGPTGTASSQRNQAAHRPSLKPSAQQPLGLETQPDLDKKNESAHLCTKPTRATTLDRHTNCRREAKSHGGRKPGRWRRKAARFERRRACGPSRDCQTLERKIAHGGALREKAGELRNLARGRKARNWVGPYCANGTPENRTDLRQRMKFRPHRSRTKNPHRKNGDLRSKTKRPREETTQIFQ